jgi:hypothetical protein
MLTVYYADGYASIRQWNRLGRFESWQWAVIENESRQHRIDEPKRGGQPLMKCGQRAT